MRANRIIKGLLISLIVTAFLIGCAKQVTNPNNSGPVTIQMKIAGVSDIQAVGYIQLTITGPGIDTPIIDTLIKDTTGYLIGRIEVPAGRDRKFVLEVRQFGEVAPGEVLYRGETTADVVPDAEIKLDIKLVPVVPMITLSPHYIEVPILNNFALDVYVYNVDSMSSLRIGIYNYYNSNVTIDSIRPGIDISGNIGFDYASGGTYETDLYYSWIVNVSSLLPRSGHYATVYCSTLRTPGTIYLYTGNFYVNDSINYYIYAGSGEIYIY
ncbi:exported hypothetical protein [Candidatus Zixiibacteriota bacterium]|nr:exported hypothetical protein [candidate division Zixibacteria bacterium]